MEDCLVHVVAFTTSEVDLGFTAVLAYSGTPDSQLRVVAMGMHEGCVTSLGKQTLAVDSGRTSPGAQIHLWGILPNPTLLVFQTYITRGVCVCQKSVEPTHLSSINGQVKHPGGSERGKASGRFCQIGTVFPASQPVSMAFDCG